MIVRKRGESMDRKGILFILPLQRLSQLADWRGGGPPGFVIPMERRWGCKKKEGPWLRCWGKIAGLLDAGVFRRYRRGTLFYCVVALSFSLQTHFLPSSPLKL